MMRNFAISLINFFFYEKGVQIVSFIKASFSVEFRNRNFPSEIPVKFKFQFHF